MLIDEVAAIQGISDLSMIDFASVRKAVTKENQSTFFDLLDRPDDIAALKQAMGELVAGRSEVTTLELKVQGQRQLTGIAWVPEIRWFILTMANPGAVASASRHFRRRGRHHRLADPDFACRRGDHRAHGNSPPVSPGSGRAGALRTKLRHRPGR